MLIRLRYLEFYTMESKENTLAKKPKGNLNRIRVSCISKVSLLLEYFQKEAWRKLNRIPIGLVGCIIEIIIGTKWSPISENNTPFQ